MSESMQTEQTQATNTNHTTNAQTQSVDGMDSGVSNDMNDTDTVNVLSLDDLNGIPRRLRESPVPPIATSFSDLPVLLFPILKHWLGCYLCVDVSLFYKLCRLLLQYVQDVRLVFFRFVHIFFSHQMCK